MNGAEEIPNEVPFTGDFLAAIIAGRHDIIEEIRELEGISWWNVSLTLAHLVRGTFSGDAAYISLVATAFRDAADIGSKEGS